MKTQEQRTNKRFPLAIRATVIDPVSLSSFPCIIRDGSITGCKILCDEIGELPDQIGLDVPSIDKIIEGKIMWRTSKAAGIAFDWARTHHDDDLQGDHVREERRAAPRQKVDIAAMVLNRDCKPIAPCTICDSSRSGCRIVLDPKFDLPTDIRFEIEGLTGAVMARVVWRRGGVAGTEFLWDSDVYLLEDDEVTAET